MADEYPLRDQFFAHKFVRLLHKAAVAAEIGRDAFALLVVVAHTEDAMRYRGAAKFWNSQLVETLGFAKWDQFDAVRQKAIDAGWLHYVSHGKRQAGEYFVLVPEGYDVVTDAPIECTGIHPENGYNDGYKVGYDHGYKAGYEVGYKQGEPSIPIPLPKPKPADVDFPAELQTEKFAEVWARWVNRRKGMRKSLTPANMADQLAQLAIWGHDKAIASLEQSIRNTWQGLFEPRDCQNGRKPAAATEFDIEWQTALQSLTTHSRFAPEKIEAEVGPAVWKALKPIGLKKLDEANDYDRQQLKAKFITEMKKHTQETAAC